MFEAPFRRLLQQVSPPAAVRAAETQAGPPPGWASILQSGFLDILLPESAGGAALPLAQFHALAAACGEASLPAPFAETAVARLLLHQRGAAAPADAAILLAPPSPILPLAAHATHALVPRGETWALIPAIVTSEDPFHCGGGTLDSSAPARLEIPANGDDLAATAAALAAARMAGGMARLLATTVDHANSRQQFGRPLGKFQAIQHQIAHMAEQLVSATAASQIGFSGPGFCPLRSAVAKCRTSEAAHEIAAIAHAVHGAIGATADHDLNLSVRRLKQLQLAFGGTDHWARLLGEGRLAAPEGTSADFIRTHLQPGAAA